MKSPVVIASNNSHKVEEIRQCLGDLFTDVLSLEDFPVFPSAIEDGKTFEENAYIKAKQVYQNTKTMALSDDSGLVVPSLKGAPGIYSARYAGPGATDKDNLLKLLQDMETFEGAQRKAYFICVLCLYKEENGVEVIITTEGRVHGTIADSPAGEKGFGYDPIFIPEGHTQTFASLGPDIKNQMSHRSVALENLTKKIKFFS